MATPEIVTKVVDMVMADRRVTERYIASAVGISQAPVAWWICESTLNTLGFSPLWFEPRLGHMWGK